jgi:hypothetical protein
MGGTNWNGTKEVVVVIVEVEGRNMYLMKLPSTDDKQPIGLKVF